MCAVKVKRLEDPREGAVAHIEAAGIGAERRHHHPLAVAGEAAAADRTAAPRHPRDRMQVAGDLAGGISTRLVAKGQRAELERQRNRPPMPSAGSGSWLPVIQIQSRPRCRPRNVARSVSASRAGPRPSWKLSPSATTTRGV